MIGIVSVGIGNIGSVKNMINKLGHEVTLLEEPVDSLELQTLILPGVGSFDNGIKRLQDSGWYSWIRENPDIKNGKLKIVGICLGMQLLCDGSDEGSLNGLGLIPGYFKKFDIPQNMIHKYKTPHMGWCPVNFNRKKDVLLKNLPEENRYYFVHSYHYTHNSSDYIIGTANHYYDFACAIKKDNIRGFQFHPEKSHRFGKTLLSEVLK